jgi:uroporphyrinogen-III synthase
MTRSLLVLRPEPGASATVAAARAMGLDAIASPLFTVHTLSWSLPDPLPEAVLMTSANAARLGGSGLAALHALPLYAVGAATAEVAREAGFRRIVTGEGDVTAIVACALRDGVTTLLHLAGRDHHAPSAEDIHIEHRIVYTVDAVSALSSPARAALPEAIALLHSPRAAALFAKLVDPTGIAIAAISEAVRIAAGRGWRIASVAKRPTDASLLAVAAKLCNHKTE